MKQLHDKSISQLEAIYNNPAKAIQNDITLKDLGADPASLDSLKAHAAARLTHQFHLSYIKSKAGALAKGYLKKGQAWALLAHKFHKDGCYYSEEEYFSLGWMFEAARLNNAEACCNYYAQSIIVNFGECLNSKEPLVRGGGLEIKIAPIVLLISFIIPYHVLPKEYAIEAIKRLNEIAEVTGNIVSMLHEIPFIKGHDSLTLNNLFDPLFKFDQDQDLGGIVFYPAAFKPEGDFKTFANQGLVFIRFFMRHLDAKSCFKILERFLALKCFTSQERDLLHEDVEQKQRNTPRTVQKMDSKKLEIFQLEQIEASTSNKFEKGILSAKLAMLLYLEFVETNERSSLSRAKPYAQFAFQQDKETKENIYQFDEYFYLARIFISPDLNKPEIAYGFYVKSIRGQRAKQPHINGNYSIIYDKALVDLLCALIDDKSSGAPINEHERQLLKALDDVALEAGNIDLEIEDELMPPHIGSVSLANFFSKNGDRPAAKFLLFNSDILTDKKYKTYSHPGFVFFELLLQKINVVGSIEVLRRLSLLGCKEASIYLARCEGQPLYSRLVRTSQLTTINGHQLNDVVQVLDVIRKNGSPDLYKVLWTKNKKETTLPASCFSLPLANESRALPDQVERLMISAERSFMDRRDRENGLLKVLSLERKTITELKAIVNCHESNEAEKGAAAARLTYIYHNGKGYNSGARDLEEAKTWTKIARDYDSGEYNAREYYSMARMLDKMDDNKSAIDYCKSVLTQFKCVDQENYLDIGIFIKSPGLLQLLNDLCFIGDPNLAKDYSLERNALNTIAENTGDIKIRIPDHNIGNSITDVVTTMCENNYFLDEDKRNCGYLFSKRKQQARGNQTNAGFIFVELLLEKCTGVGLVNVLKRCEKRGFPEAKPYLERAKGDVKGLYSKVICWRGIDVAKFTSEGRVDPSVVILRRVLAGERDEAYDRYWVQIVNTGQTMEIDARNVSLPMRNKDQHSRNVMFSDPLVNRESRALSTQEERKLPATSPRSLLHSAPVGTRGSTEAVTTTVSATREEAQVLTTSFAANGTFLVQESIEGLNAGQIQILQTNIAMNDRPPCSSQDAEFMAAFFVLELRKLNSQLHLQAQEIQILSAGQIRNTQELVEVTGRLTVQEVYLYNVVKRVKELGAGLNYISDKIAKLDECTTINDALVAGRHFGASKFLTSFVRAIEVHKMLQDMIVSQLFVYDYGRKGLVLNIIVGLANLVPVFGFGSLASGVKATINYFQGREIQSVSRKTIKCFGEIGNLKDFATAIAMGILKYSGYEIDTCHPDDMQKIINACKDSTVQAILELHEELKLSEESRPDLKYKIHIEDIVCKVLSGVGMDNSKAEIQNIIAIQKGGLVDTRKRGEARIEYDWLEGIMKSYAKTLPTHLPSFSESAEDGERTSGAPPQSLQKVRPTPVQSAAFKRF